MDRRGLKIVGACIVCTLTVLLLFLAASKLTQSDCELIFVEPENIRASLLNERTRLKPKRSDAKTLLLKISANLEYIRHEADSSTMLPQQLELATATLSSAPPSVVAHQLPVAQAPLTQVSEHSASQTPAAAVKQQQQPPLSPVVPATPQTGFNQTSGLSSYYSHSREKKYLPLQLEQIQERKLDEFELATSGGGGFAPPTGNYTKTKYTLNFNCSTIHLVFVRLPERVFVEHIRLELKVESRKRNECEIRVPKAQQSQGLFGVEVAQDGWARYSCERHLKYGCYNYQQPVSNQTTTTTPLHLLDLHIQALEFQLPGSNSSQLHKQREFSSSPRECEPLVATPGSGAPS